MSRAGNAIAISAICTSLAVCCVMLRAVSRFLIVKRSDADDYLIIASAALSVTLTALIVAREWPELSLNIAD